MLGQLDLSSSEDDENPRQQRRPPNGRKIPLVGLQSVQAVEIREGGDDNQTLSTANSADSKGTLVGLTGIGDWKKPLALDILCAEAQMDCYTGPHWKSGLAHKVHLELQCAEAVTL